MEQSRINEFSICPCCKKRDHLKLTTEELYDTARDTTQLSGLVMIECQMCDLYMSEYAFIDKTTDYQELVSNLKKRWNSIIR